MKLDLAIEELHRSENDLHHQLLQIADRHKADHEVFHIARDLAAWSAEHIAALAEIGKHYGVDLDATPKGESRVLGAVRQKASELVGRSPEPGLLMLRDLRELYMKASGVSLDWELLGQAAQGAKQQELLELTTRCHPDTLRQARWANSKLKVSSVQVLLT